MIWHIAFAVDDLDTAMAEFGAALQLDWNPVKHYRGASTDRAGRPYEVDTRLTFATAGPCALELFEQTPGTPNEPRKGTAFHHLGYWVDDLAAEAGRLEACSWFREGGDVAPDARAAFFASSLGIFIEGCNVGIARPGLERYYPTAPPSQVAP